VKDNEGGGRRFHCVLVASSNVRVRKRDGSPTPAALRRSPLLNVLDPINGFVTVINHSDGAAWKKERLKCVAN